MQLFIRRITNLVLLFSLFRSPVQAANNNGEDKGEILAISTISDINRLVSLVSFYAQLEINVESGIVFEEKYLLEFSNYLDYNVVGAGKTIFIYPSLIAKSIAEKINSGTPPGEVAHAVILEFQEGKFLVNLNEAANDADQLRVKVGAYIVGEFEFHQEPDGKYLPLLELNQAKLFFSGIYQANNSRKNAVSFLAEFNPLPEEVIHQVDQAVIRGDSVNDTIAFIEPTGEGPIPFERLQFTLTQIGGSGFSLTMGQLRNPFGMWSDFTSHRNFSSTKNNTLVSGYALKKIELGLQVEYQKGPFAVQAALVQGRMGRTAPLFRADNDDRFDLVARFIYSRKGLTLGASAYFAELGTERMALGIDAQWQIGPALIGTEIVYQKNDAFGELYTLQTSTGSASSIAGYVQADVALSSRLHLYGLYDLWQFSVDGQVVNRAAFKAFQGLRYYIAKNVRWTIVEYGRMAHEGFDEGFNHLSTQMEVTF